MLFRSKPNNPICNQCPIRNNCKSFRKKDFTLAKNIKKNKEKYFILKVYKKDQRYLLIKNTKFNFLKNLSIFPMEELSNPKNFNEQIKKEVQNISDLAILFVERSTYETRLQVLHFLFGVGNADGNVSSSELDKINQIAYALGIRTSDFDSIKAMFIKDTGSSYKVLEILPSASNDEVKKAYREMAKRYHPDKLQSKDPALIKGAQEKFQEVQKAYETIQKERNL